MLDTVTIELSGKAFADDSQETAERVARTLFRQWNALIARAKSVSVLLWIADGSEILNYSGDEEQTFEWAYWIGIANPNPNIDRTKCTERQRQNTLLFPVKYREDAKPRSYRWLRETIATLRRVHAEVNPGKELRVGATFDCGPEFAVSDFKFRRHREIAMSHTIYPNSFICCIARLHADETRYAAFPDGIPEGTGLGCFLGAQFREFAADLGFDYLWLSNGFGFGLETWGVTGALFDKKRFFPERRKEAKEALLAFWRDLYASCPGIRIETRGSNFSAGVEMATDACPMKTLYEQYRIAPPVNSPWAALNYNSGLEIAAWMSHIADTCGDPRIPYRFYIHDPWFNFSPWQDRYGRLPWDICQPLSVARIEADGTVCAANRIAFMTADNSWGRMPEQPTHEVTAAVGAALDELPDAPAPLLWVYGLDEYQEMTTGKTPRLEAVFNEEIFLGEALQEGLPLNTVVNTRHFRALAAGRAERFSGKLLVIPASILGSDNLNAVRAAAAAGADVLVYGSLRYASQELCRFLGMKRADELTGEFRIEDRAGVDAFPGLSDAAWVCPPFADGGLSELADTAESLAEAVAPDGSRRTLAAVRGRVAFVRAIPAYSPENAVDTLPVMLTPDKGFPGARLMRETAARFGWSIACAGKDAASPVPRTTLHRHDNAFIFAVFALDATVSMRLRTPYGAPIPDDGACEIDGDGAVWPIGKFTRNSVRCFARQGTSSVIRSSIQPPGHTTWFIGQRRYQGLVDAEVRVFVPNGREERLEALAHPTTRPDYLPNLEPLSPAWEQTPDGLCACFRHVSGYLFIRW